MNTSPTSKTIDIKATDLNPQGGVFCPNKLAGMQLWNSHPRVFLDIGKTGDAKCPYCGTQYHLAAGEHVGGHH
jgi:uncharacterized Zn-finger protein